MKKILSAAYCFGLALGCQGTPTADGPSEPSPAQTDEGVQEQVEVPLGPPKDRYVSVAATTRVVKEVVLVGHEEEITAVQETYRQVITASSDGVVRVWKFDNHMPSYTTKDLEVLSLDFNGEHKKNRERLVIGSDKVSIWQLNFHGEVTPAFDLPTDSPSTGVFSPDGGRILLQDLHGRVSVWDATSGEKIAAIRGEFSHPAVFNPDGTLVGTVDGGVKLYNASTGSLKNSFSGSDFATIEFSPDGESVLAAGPEIVLLDADTLKPIRQLVSADADCQAAHFSPSGSRILTLCGNYSGRATHLGIWDADDGKAVTKWEETVDTAEFHDEGTTLITLSKGAMKAKLWNVENGELLAELGHDFGISFARFAGWTRGGIRAVTADRHGVVKLWEIELGVL